MKVKVKLSVEQFKHLVNFINDMIYKKVVYLSELEIINLKMFIAQGYKKLIDLRTIIEFTPLKDKTFNIEINQLYCVLEVLSCESEFLDSYLISVHETLKRQNKSYYINKIN